MKEQKKAELRVAVENLINRGVDCRDILLSVFDLLEDVYLFPRTYQINMCGHEFILHHGKIYAEIAREYNQEESLSRLVEMAVMKYRINESIQINTWQFVAVVSEIHSDQRLKDAIDVYLEQYDKDNGRFLDGQHCTLW